MVYISMTYMKSKMPNVVLYLVDLEGIVAAPSLSLWRPNAINREGLEGRNEWESMSISAP